MTVVGSMCEARFALARRHLRNGMVILYDVTSAYFEGRTCPLAKLGYSRDGKRNKLQIVFGLLCTAEGCPIAVEVFEGNVGDPSTLASQINKLKQRFAIERVVRECQKFCVRDFVKGGFCFGPFGYRHSGRD
jgi:hypothetical protein